MWVRLVLISCWYWTMQCSFCAVQVMLWSRWWRYHQLPIIIIMMSGRSLFTGDDASVAVCVLVHVDVVSCVQGRRVLSGRVARCYHPQFVGPNTTSSPQLCRVSDSPLSLLFKQLKITQLSPLRNHWPTVDESLICFVNILEMWCRVQALGVLRRQPHRRSGLANLPSVGAVP